MEQCLTVQVLVVIILIIFVLDNPEKDGKKRTLIQYSESYQHKDGREWSPTVNVMHTWVESI